MDPTIYALSTAPGRAAIAIIRISGAACLTVYQSLCPGKQDPKPRYATVRSLYEPGEQKAPDTVLDSSALVLYFPAPKTATGEDLLELHVHGGTAVVKAVLAAISRCTGSEGHLIRYAEPGEFTRRAFMNDRLDLTQVEALGDTLAANTEQQRRLSVRGTGNSLAKQYEKWRQQLLYARGELEALIDFSEDQHFDESLSELLSSVSAQIEVLRRAVLAYRDNAVKGELLRNGISLALLGAPNAGKSSLLNRIVGREAAIVSTEAGTTRDVVEISIDIGGYLCRLGDTAGLRRPSQESVALDTGSSGRIGVVEQEGMKRAKARAKESDVVVVVLSLEADTDASVTVQLDPEVLETATRLVEERDNVLVVVNKADIANAKQQRKAIDAVQAALPTLPKDRIHIVSCIDDERPPGSTAGRQDSDSIQLFLRGLTQHFSALTAAGSPESGGEQDMSIWQESLGASERHRLLLDTCISSLDDFTQLVRAASNQSLEDDGDADVVLAAEYLRAAANSLAKITGKGVASDVEEVLGVVFEKFCVGK